MVNLFPNPEGIRETGVEAPHPEDERYSRGGDVPEGKAIDFVVGPAPNMLPSDLGQTLP